MLVFKFIRSETHFFLCSCVLGVGCWWVVGVGVYALSASPCSNSQKRNHIVKCSGGMGVVGWGGCRVCSASTSPSACENTLFVRDLK